MTSHHPISEALAGVHAALDGIGSAQALYLSPAVKKQALRDVARAEARLAAVKLSVLAVASDVAEETGARDPGAWLAVDQRLDRRAAHADHRLATALDTTWTRTAAALATGDLHVEQARAITNVLEQITTDTDTEPDIDPDIVAQAEEALLAEAKHLTPTQLRRLGRRLLDHLDPEGAHEREAKKLADEEAHAHHKQRLSLRRLGDGTTRLSGLIPDEVAHRLSTYLEAFAQPRKQATEADGRLLPRKRLLAMALSDFLTAQDPDRLPDHGGDATTIIVAIDFESLKKDLATAGLGFDPDGDDLHITADHARRMACRANLIPVVLGQPGEVLDVGRRHRLHTPAMRRAIRLRDKTCTAQGCDVPAPWCEVHHVVPWSQGGRTSITNGTLLCSHHHHLVHNPAYHHERLPDGTIRYHRRT